MRSSITYLGNSLSPHAQHMVLELALGIASAIRHLHSKQVVHGDLNPRCARPHPHPSQLGRDDIASAVTLCGIIPCSHKTHER